MLTLLDTICLGVLLLLQATAQDALFPHEAKVPTFQINLDLHPRKRWVHVVQYYMNKYAHHPSLNPKVNWTEEAHKMVDMVMPQISGEFLQEMLGVAEALDSPNVDLRTMVLRHLRYEMGLRVGFECSGIVAAGKNGQVVHGRNLDMGREFGFLRQLTMNAEFTRHGVVQFRAPTFFSMLGVHTATKPGYWSYQQNTRFHSTLAHDGFFGFNGTGLQRSSAWLNASLVAASMGGKPFLLEARRLMEGNYSFQQAVVTLCRTRFIAPQYFILAGAKPYEGAVLSLDRIRPGKEAYVDVQLLSRSTGHWFLVETNDDRWDSPTDVRKAAAEFMIKASKRITPASIMRTLRTQPVCNNGTIFSWVSMPSRGTMTTNISMNCTKF